MPHEPAHPYDEVLLESYDGESVNPNQSFDSFSPFEQEDRITEGEDEPVYEYEFESEDEGPEAFELEEEVTSGQLYEKLNLSAKKLSSDIFSLAMSGYRELKQNGKLKNDRYLTVVDFSQPGTQNGCT